MSDKIITRQIQIHHGADGVQVRQFGPHQWICVHLTEDESITVFLEPSDIKRLAAEFRALDEALELKAQAEIAPGVPRRQVAQDGSGAVADFIRYEAN